MLRSYADDEMWITKPKQRTDGGDVSRRGGGGREDGSKGAVSRKGAGCCERGELRASRVRGSREQVSAVCLEITPGRKVGKMEEDGRVGRDWSLDSMDLSRTKNAWEAKGSMENAG